ncbi:MAG: VCBS repeat-containing protein [Chitinophagaceae bacterium]|nr:VCBS repeat-containing protein [Chitinophagaceae bacterium]
MDKTVRLIFLVLRVTLYDLRRQKLMGIAMLVLVPYIMMSQDNRVSLRVLAYQYLQKNQVNEAEAAFVKAIKISPDEILNYRDLAILYLTEKNYGKAENIARAGVKLKPGNDEMRAVLAKIYAGKGEKQNAVNELNTIIQNNRKNIFACYALANLYAPGQKNYLLKALSLAPANVVIRADLAAILTRNNKADSAIYYLQEIKKIATDFSPAINSFYNQAIQALRSNQFSRALVHINRFHDLLRVTGAYIEALSVLEGPKLSSGYADFASGQVQNKKANARRATVSNTRFTDATDAIGLDNKNQNTSGNAVVAVTDYSESGEMYLYSSSIIAGKQKCYLLVSSIGNFQEARTEGGTIDHAYRDLDAAFIDYDNDGYPDLFIATTQGILLFKNRAGGAFIPVRQNIGLNNTAHTERMLFADFDQDGDIDLYTATKGVNRFFRNNGNGSFTEQANAMGLAIPGGTNAMDFADYDVDGDLDIITISDAAGTRLLNNNRHAAFKDVTGLAGLKNEKLKGSVVVSADYNNDGMPDLFIAGASQSLLLKNVDGARFVADPASKILNETVRNTKIMDAAFTDFDNDGHLDLIVTGIANNASSRGIQLFHNDSTKGFSNVSHLLPATPLQATRISIADFNLDGDDDVFLATPGGVKLLRNDGGNLNHYMQVQLTGLSYGNNKNNRLGIGAQVELKAGDLYQLRTIKRGITNFGLGARNAVDAVRIIWPNGTPQVIKDPSAKERIIEEQMLKGSCPFLFVWNGKEYEFLKDMMWRSALGMPLTVNGRDTTYAFSDPSKEYLLIPGEKLQPKDNHYSIKITEELWEAVYFDKAGLVAVDHPDSVDVFADERFVAPPFPGKQVYSVAAKHYPLSATDHNGNDLLSKITAYDFQYIANFELGKYQGLTEDHDLILDLGDRATSDALFLFLRGWIFPTDASINASLTQSAQYKVTPPALQVINKKGEWQTVIPNIGFPMGKDKMVIVDLSGKFLTPDNRKIRIRTNMQLYWDEIFYSNGLSKAPVQMHDLAMVKAALSFRGYSASYRKGGPFGPHWFDYYQTGAGQKWRDLTGYYTRYGDVLPLLLEGDDEYIICNSGDEVSIEFDAGNLPVLPKGWKRDFLIYSEGWVKDGDLNTAHGQTVEPLPFHSMPSYPYKGNVSYPFEKHKAYMQQYNTREVSTDEFKNALKLKKEATGGD